MLAILVHKELRTQLSSLRFAVVSWLQVAALAAGFEAMGSQHRVATELYQANVAAARAANEHAAETVDHFDYEHVHRRGSYLAVPPHPMGWLVSGLSAAVPSQIHVADDHERQVDKGLYRNPMIERVPAPDLLFLTRMLLSLLAVLYAFDAVCAEREEGTLRQVLAGPVPRHLWLLGKWLAGIASLATGFVLGILVGLLCLMVEGVPVLTRESLVTLGATAAVSLLYVALFYTLGLCISTRCRYAATSVVVSLLAWAVVTLVLPGLTVETARVLVPAPARTHVIAETHEIVKATRIATWAAGRELRDNPDARQARVADLRAEQDRRIEALEADYRRGVLAQAQMVEGLSRLLPAGCLTQALTRLAGTGMGYVEDLQAAQARAKAAYVAAADEPEPPAPTIVVGSARWSERAAGMAIDVGLLAGYLVALFAAANASFLRYDVS